MGEGLCMEVSGAHATAGARLPCMALGPVRWLPVSCAREGLSLALLGILLQTAGCGGTPVATPAVSPTSAPEGSWTPAGETPTLPAGFPTSPSPETESPLPPNSSPSVTATPPAPTPAGPAPSPSPVIYPSVHNTLLGRPTATSIALSVLMAQPGDALYVAFSTQLSSDGLSLAGVVRTSATVSSPEGQPVVLDLDGLSADTRYYYQVWYRSSGEAFVPDMVHSFVTQRAPGKTFRFGVQGDTHPERYNNKMFHSELMTLTMQEVRDRQPDFYFMLGDDFSIEKIIQNFKETNFPSDTLFEHADEGSWSYERYLTDIPFPFLQDMIVDGAGAPTGNAAYRELREKYLGIMGNATALFLVNGNHEQAHAANIGGIFNNASIWAADARLKYYPLPAPGPFYAMDSEPRTARNGYPTLAAPDGLLRDYYAFTWGDALFVSIDPYWHSEEVAPDSSVYNGDQSVDPWAATMGDAQYFWLKDVLETSTARWKFVFAHHINGDGRGGASCVGVQEWGGKVKDFTANRPSWEEPIHALLVDTGVTVFFQGHDHLFSREVVDGVVYQSVPNPADNSYFAYNCTAYDPETITWQGPAGYGQYDPDQGVILPNTGFLDVRVSPEAVRIAYVRTYREEDLAANPNGSFTGTEVSGEEAFVYSIPPQPGDDSAAASVYTCQGDAPPDTWVYLP